ncbi:MAG TPA: site-2 protease family protein [Vicinamibacteria bacterium]|nr:site-2 protease family protein [Vicinamibacteria bacterium]
MRGSGSHAVRVARVFGIPVFVHASWLVIFGLVAWTLATGYFPERHPDLSAAAYWARGLITSLLFFASILLHELGHSLVALRHGIPIRSITLFIFGGVARLARDPEDGRTELEIAAAGPAVSLLLGAVFYAASTVGALGEAGAGVAWYLACINLAVAVFNLVPAFPLDGGRLLRGLLWKAAGKGRATRTAARAGTVFAYVLVATGVWMVLRGEGLAGLWYVLIGWFLREASAGAYRDVRLDEALAGVTVAEAMLREFATLPAGLSLAEAAREHFLRTGYGGYPVLRADSVVGLLCLRDVLERSPEDREITSVQAVMTPLTPAIVAAPGDPLLQAASQMAEAGTGRLLVMDEGRLTGLLTLQSVLRQVRVREQLA